MHYPDDVWKRWNSITEDQKKEYADQNPVSYTDQNGHYSISQITQYRDQPLNVYVVTIDTSGVYKAQTQKGQIQYTKVTGPSKHEILVAGGGRVDFVIEKE